ncbi:MAG: recombinase family protein [Nitrospirae bacterium]|nr:recombinase family protein [Nitrospirota bacterium]
MENLKVAVYGRVSTTDKGQDVGMQIRELKVFADNRGWEVLEYVDNGISGLKEKRPAFDKLMADARDGRFQVVLVWKMDRLARSLRHLLNTLNELQMLGIAFVSLKENIDFTSSVGKLMTHILGAFAQFERDIIAERVKSGIANARSKGRQIGRTPKAHSDFDKIIELSGQGLSERKIGKVLNLAPSTVYSVIKKQRRQNGVLA